MNNNTIGIFSVPKSIMLGMGAAIKYSVQLLKNNPALPLTALAVMFKEAGAGAGAVAVAQFPEHVLVGKSDSYIMRRSIRAKKVVEECVKENIGKESEQKETCSAWRFGDGKEIFNNLDCQTLIDCLYSNGKPMTREVEFYYENLRMKLLDNEASKKRKEGTLTLEELAREMTIDKLTNKNGDCIVPTGIVKWDVLPCRLFIFCSRATQTHNKILCPAGGNKQKLVFEVVDSGEGLAEVTDPILKNVALDLEKENKENKKETL